MTTVPPPASAAESAAGGGDPFDRLVLLPIATSDEANLGAIARAMKNFGFRRLTITAPRAAEPKSGRARALAAGAEDVLMGARVVRSLDDALALDGIELLAGTTARRSRQRGPFLTPLEWALAAWRELSAGRTVGLLLGREDYGLNNDEIDRCHWKISIPTAEALRSLNLAQAALLVLHTLHEVRHGRLGRGGGGRAAGSLGADDEGGRAPAAGASLPPDLPAALGDGDRAFAAEEAAFRRVAGSTKAAGARRPATAAEQERLARAFERLLGAIDYLWETNPAKSMRPFRLLVGRARPTSREVGILSMFVRRALATLEDAGVALPPERGAPPDADSPAGTGPGARTRHEHAGAPDAADSASPSSAPSPPPRDQA